MKTISTAELNENLNRLAREDEDFFRRAFEGQTTPEPLKRLATRLCLSYGIRGICDPQYIANVIAFELGLGDGQGNFKPLPKP